MVSKQSGEKLKERPLPDQTSTHKLGASRKKTKAIKTKPKAV
jgi:hypothetical protein